MEAADGRQGAGLDGHKTSITSAVSGSNGRNLASGDADGSIRIWKFATRQTIVTLRPPIIRKMAVGLAYSPDGKSLAATTLLGESRQNALTAWELAPGQESSLARPRLPWEAVLPLPQSLALALAYQGNHSTCLSIFLRLITQPKPDSSARNLGKSIDVRQHTGLWDVFNSREVMSAPLRTSVPSHSQGTASSSWRQC